jgi:FixJ family two-component response regulator
MIQPLVSVVDHDPIVLNMLESALHQRGCGLRTYSSGEEFLAADGASATACIIIDVDRSGSDGLELQARLVATGCESAIIVLTTHEDIPTSVRAIKAGALDVLGKPIQEAHLLSALDEALRLYAEQSRVRALRSTIEHRLGTLTARERQVLDHVVAGRLNKQIAAELGVVEDTIKMHRSRAMRKLGVRSLPDLVRFMLRASRNDPSPNETISSRQLRV